MEENKKLKEKSGSAGRLGKIENVGVAKHLPAYFWPAIAAAVLIGFLLASLPYTVIGEVIGIEDIVKRLNDLERKIHRVRSLAEYRMPDKFELCGQPFPLQRADVKENIEREFYLSLGQRTGAIVWVKRSGRFFPYIESALRARGMPDDLKYLAVAESDLNVYSESFAGAVGLWQFMPATGAGYGLKIDRFIDERRDSAKSTEAALDFLQRLYSSFNDWFLVMASYNAGPGRISEAMKDQRVSSYFDMNLPVETERYVYRIAAIKLIMSNVRYYGLDVSPDEMYRPIKYDIVTISVPSKNLHLGKISDSIGISFKELREMNPQLESSYLPRGSCRVVLPAGTADRFMAAWEGGEKSKEPEVQKEAPSKPDNKIHVVKSGETLASIARKYNVSISDIRKWNNMKPDSVLQAGKKLIIH